MTPNHFIAQLFKHSVKAPLGDLTQNDCCAWLAHSVFVFHGFVCVQAGPQLLACDQKSGCLEDSWNHSQMSHSFVFEHDQLGDRVVLKSVPMFDRALISCKLQNDKHINTVQIKKDDIVKKVHCDFDAFGAVDQFFELIDKELIKTVTSRASTLSNLSSYTSQVTASLRVALNQMKVDRPNEALFLLCHCIMVVDGFRPLHRSLDRHHSEHEEIKSDEGNISKALKLCSLSSCSMEYNWSQENDYVFSLKAMPMLDNLLIYAKRKETEQELGAELINPKYCFKVSIPNYFDTSKDGYCLDSYKNLPELISNFRNSISKRLQTPFKSQYGVHSLPTDVMVEVLSYLHSSELIQTSKINRIFNILENCDWLWKNLCQRELGVDVSELKKTRWKLEFIAHVLKDRQREKEIRTSLLRQPGPYLNHWDPFSPFAPYDPHFPWQVGPVGPFPVPHPAAPDHLPRRFGPPRPGLFSPANVDTFFFGSDL